MDGQAVFALLGKNYALINGRYYRIMNKQIDLHSVSAFFKDEK